jgi:CRISPR system Cascade subunit CasE
MYLTRFRFNTARRASRGLLSGPQRIHAAVLHGFPEPERPQGGGRILWRLDQSSRHDALLYIASPEEPDLTHLVEQAGWSVRDAAGGWDTRPYGKLLASLDSGQRWAFRLTANPVHYVRVKSDEPKRWLPHATPGQQMRWLLDRCASRGFTIPAKADGAPNLTIHDRSWLRFSKGEERRDVTIRAVGYEGVLEVQDAELLRDSLVSGIGKAKAYGCGMLTLAPLGPR